MQKAVKYHGCVDVSCEIINLPDSYQDGDSNETEFIFDFSNDQFPETEVSFDGEKLKIKIHGSFEALDFLELLKIL